MSVVDGLNRAAAWAVVALIVGLSACTQKPEEPAPEAKPAEPTPEQIADEMRPIIEPLRQLAASDLGFLRDDVRDQAVQALREAKQKHQGTVNGRQAIRIITHEIREIIRSARNQERWRLVLGCIDAHEALDPESQHTTILKKRAEVYRNRPEVEVVGFFEDLDEEVGAVYAFLKVTLRPNNETHIVQVRKGAVFHGLQFVDIVGKMKGVKLEYLAIPGYTWEVLMHS